MIYLGIAVVLLLLYLILRLETFMSTTNQGLTALQADMAKLQAANTQILADVTKLLANQQPGLQPGQVIVNQADIDALDATVQGITSGDTTADATVNPPAKSAS
jgi:hypothetical protein